MAPSSITWTEADRESGERQRADAADLYDGLGPVLCGLKEAIFATDPAGVIVYANAASEALTHVIDADALGQPLAAVVRLAESAAAAPAEDIASIAQCVHRAERAGAPVAVAAPDGSVASARATWIFGASGAVLVLRPAALPEDTPAFLLGADRTAALGTLAAGVAHEINNPLTYLLIDLDHVLRRLRQLSASTPPDDDHLHEEIGGFVRSVTRAVEGARRVQKIVRDLATFSQGDVAHRRLVDVRGVLESSLQLAWHEIRHRARLVKNLSEVPPVEANEARLAQVFLALLINAAQAIPEGHAEDNEVRVTTRLDEESIVVEISDTGVGISEDALPRVFDPFYTTKPVGGGTGLGLSVAHGIVRGMGGELRAESAPGRGTTFRVILSAARSFRRVSTGKMRAVQPRKRILLIEEEPQVRDALEEALSDEVDVVAVHDARRGLELIDAKEDFDLVLCDLIMPTMSGMDLYLEIVRAAPHLAGRIAFMTGGVFTPRARSFLEGVGNRCLEKPIDMSELRSLLART